MAAKKKENPAAKTPPPDSDDTQTTTTIVLRRERQVGEDVLKVDAKLATVVLEDGVGLNFLVDAIRNGVAGEAVVEPDAGAIEPSGKPEND